MTSYPARGRICCVMRLPKAAATVLLILVITFASVLRAGIGRPTGPSTLAHHVRTSAETPAGHGGMHPQSPDGPYEAVIGSAVSIDHVRTDRPLTLTAIPTGHPAALGHTSSRKILLERPTDRPHRRTLVLLI